MYAIGYALLLDLSSPTFQQRYKASEIGQNHIGPLEASSGFCFRPRRNTSQDQYGQTPEGSGGSNISVQAIPHTGDVGRANAPEVGHEFQAGCLRLPNNDGFLPCGGAQRCDNLPPTWSRGGQRIGIGGVQIRGNESRPTANSIMRMF